MVDDFNDQQDVVQNSEESYDANNPEQINKARKKAGRAKSDDLEVVKAIMDLPSGRAWFYRILSRCGTFTAPAYNNQHDTDRGIGRQIVGHWILEDIMNSSPEKFWQMYKENRSRK